MLTKPFNQLDKHDANIAGGKGASLGEMTQAGIPVPPGFVVLASTFDRFIDETGLTTKIEAILQATDTNKSGEVEKSSEKIQTLILSKETPQDIKQDILQNFKKLNAKFVAVRSSATSEDSASAAWAGQLDSFLNTTEKSLLDNVKRCWASLFTPRAIFYRFEQKLNKDKISVAVVVQKMVNSEKSGIAFSVHPVTQKENQIIIEAGFGLGEAIVSGSVTPDSYVIDKNNLQILDINVSEQTRALYKKPVGGSEWQELGTLGATQALAEKQILELAQLIIQIEKHYGFPCDIEWAFENNKFYIVQSRPITTLDNNKTKDKKNNFLDKEWTKIWTTEYTMFSIWLFGREYTESCKKVLDFGFDDIIFLVEGNLATVYRDNKRQEEFVKFLAEKSLLDVGFKDKCLKMCQKLNDKLLQYINLEEAEALKYDNFSNFIEIHQQFIAYFLVALWSPNGFPAINVSEKMKNKVFKEYEYARKLTEHTYPDIEKYIKKLYLYISKKEKIDAKLLGAMLPEELLAYIKFGKLPAASVLKQRYDYAVVLSDAKENKLVLGEEAKAIVEKISGIDTKGMKEISGSIANKGNIVGRVRKIFMAKDMSNFKSGEILVTTMTRPEWLPIMKMAAGFITDAGGVLSHAAIVSRELNKPCIIGTKIATQVLKDGDLVEVDADNGVVRILEGEQNQKEKSLYEKYMESLQGNESFTFSGPFSNLFTAFPWGNDKYYSKYYKTPPFSFLYIGKGREATETFDNTKYKLYAKEIFQNFIEHKITLESLENNFNTLTKKAEIIYKKKIDDSIKTFKEALDLLMHLIAATLYVELFDKNIVEEILKNKINDLDWEKATHPQFESFKSRWDQKIKKAKTLEEVQYIFTDYFFIKDLDYIKKEVENIKSKKIEKEQSKQVKTLNADWAKYTQLVMKIRDFRKDSIQMLSVVMARCAQALYPTAKIDEITNLNGLEVINENLPTIDELRKRQSGYVMLIRPDLTYEISYEQYEEAKKQISSASILGNELRGTVARKGKVTGKVKIILDSESNKDFKVGEILVTSMTRPEFVFLMKKSAAIITNEGGISCHAAIISRELNIPCIIGTKIATQVLKDGDLVEVDADNGVVRILENNIEGCLDFFEKYLDKYKFQVEGGRAAFYLLNYFLVNQYTVENKEWPLNEINVISNSLDHKAKWIRIHKDQLEYEKILIKFIKNPELTGLLYKYLKKNSDFAIKTLKNKNFKNVSNNELLDFFGVVCDCYYKILRPSVIIRLVDLGLINRFEKIFANKKDVENYAAIVSINKKLSSALSEKIEMLSLATKISKTKSINSKYISSGLSKIIEKYCFSELGYYNEKVKTKEDYFIKLLDFSKNNPKLQLKKIKDEQKEALKKYSELLKKLNNKDKVAVGIASELAYIKDQYKLLMNKALYFSEPLFLEIAKRTNKTVNYIKDLSPDEIKDLLDRKDVDEEFITKRANNHVLVTFKKKLYVLTDGDADKFRLAYLENDKAKRELFGRTVFPGHILGTVKVILEQKDFAKMKEGDILVVMTTSPDFTLIMKKAKAIVAEEGGLTSHTAIVSREMKIPAIVGVHHATAILHDGDLVEVDADNGVVRILESKDGNELNTTINNKEAGAQGENKKTNYAHHKIVMNLFHSCGFMKAFQKKYESRFLLTEVTVKWVKFHPELSESILDQNGDGGEFLLKKIISGEVKFRDFFYNKSLEVIKLAEKLDKLSYDNLKFGKKIVLDQFYQSYTDVISMMYAIGYVLDPVFDTYIAENKIILKNSEHISFIEKEKYELREILKKNSAKALKEHALKYNWIVNTLAGERPVGVDYFAQRKDEVASLPAKKMVDKKIHKPNNILEWIDLITYIRDQRKKCNLLASGLFDRYLKSECKRLNLSYDDAVMHTIDEFESKKNSGLEHYLDNRYLRTNNEGENDISKEEWLAKLESITEEHTALLKGSTANKGVVKGVAKIILGPSDFQKFNNRDIIIASMTRPECAPLFGKAAGIVTDIGGITCHAAIISRELNIPCVIGTKNATDAIKDGDLIEVDGDNGVVRILESNNIQNQSTTIDIKKEESDQSKNIFSKFIDGLEKDVFYPLVPVTIFAGGAGGFLPNFEKKIKNLNIRFLVAMKDNEASVLMSETRYRMVSERFFVDYTKNTKILQKTTEYLNNLEQKVNSIYSELSYKNIEIFKEQDTLRKLQTIITKVREYNCKGWFSTQFDKELVVDFIKKNSLKIKPETIEKIWNKAIIPLDDSFDKRKHKRILQLILDGKEIKTIAEEMQYAYAGYTNIKQPEEIQKSIEKEYAKYIKNKPSIISEIKKENLDYKQAKKLLMFGKKTLNKQERVLVDYIQAIIAIRDKRKDIIGKGLAISFRVGEKILKESNLDKDLIYYCAYEEFLKGVDYFKQHQQEIIKRPDGVLFLNDYNGEIEFSYDDFEKTKKIMETTYLESRKIKRQKFQKGFEGLNIFFGVQMLAFEKINYFTKNRLVQDTFCFYKDNYLTVCAYQDETEKIRDFVMKQTKPLEYLEKLYKTASKDFINFNKKSSAFLEEINSNNSVSKLKKWINNFVEYASSITAPGFLAEMFAGYDGYWIDYIGITKEEFSALTAPEELSFSKTYEYELAKIKLGLSKDKPMDIVKKYHWALNNYYKVDLVTEKYVENQLQNMTNVEAEKIENESKSYSREVIQRKKELLTKLKLDQNKKKMINVLSSFIFLQDERKEVILRTNSILYLACKKLLSLYDLKEADKKIILSAALPIWFSELSSDKLLELSKLAAHGFYYPIVGNNLFGAEAIKKLNELIDQKQEENKTEIKGQIAYPGKVRGKVNIILRDKDFSKFKAGDILVTSMTRPEFIPILKLASACITDEGGITCHAAIVSREMKKPCIIGTKIATHILKDGDLVEVDADSGVVTILKRAKSIDEPNLVDFKNRKWVVYGVTSYPVYLTPYLYVPSHVFQDKYGITNEVIGLWNGKVMDWLYDESQLVELAEKLLPDLLKQKWEYYNSWKIKADEFDKLHYQLYDLDVSKLSEVEFKSWIKKYYNAFVVQYTESNFIEPLSFYFQNHLKALLANEGILDKEAERLAGLYGAPSKPNYIKECIKEYNNAKSAKALAAVIKKFHYIKNDYTGSQVVTKNDLEQFALKHFLLPLQKIKKGGITEQGNNLLEVLQLMATIQDVRKAESLMWVSGAEKLLREYAKRNNTPFSDLLYATWDEVVRGDFDQTELKYRAEHCVIDWQVKKTNIYSGDAAVKLRTDFRQSILGTTGEISELKGFSASRGKVTGRVVVVFNVSQFNKVNKGDILVTSMTRPEYLPIMSIAAAFVTDEGGITSHAAIVAREMNKPCVIGTKIATKVLKDGDLVEVDADSGIIRIIK